MWKQHGKQRNTDDDDDVDDDERESRRRHGTRRGYEKRLYSDNMDDVKVTKSTKAGPWTRKLMEYEEKDPDR